MSEMKDWTHFSMGAHELLSLDAVYRDDEIAVCFIFYLPLSWELVDHHK